MFTPEVVFPEEPILVVDETAVDFLLEISVVLLLKSFDEFDSFEGRFPEADGILFCLFGY